MTYKYWNPNVKTWPFADQIRYNRLFQQVLQKAGESSINYIKIFHNTRALEISVGNSDSED